jgi:hypothetical protein
MQEKETLNLDNSEPAEISSCLLTPSTCIHFRFIQDFLGFLVWFSRPLHRGFDFYLRKEVIQGHLPVALPCYDFVPVIDPTFGGSPLSVRIPTSGVANSHDVTGGVYKARERIHRSIADLRLLATPSSCRRVAACNLN